MNIILSSDRELFMGFPEHWLKYNEIPYRKTQFWDNSLPGYRLPADLEHTIVIWNHEELSIFFTLESSISQLLDFFKRNNKLWIVGVDSSMGCLAETKKLKMLEGLISKNQLFLLLDAPPTDRCWLAHLQNISVTELNSSWFLSMPPRIQSASLCKDGARHDFLLTTIVKKIRPHRKLLWQSLCQRPGLQNRGLVSVRKHRDKSHWVGRTSPLHNWQDGHASMDLYQDCWLEVVCETAYKHIYFVTEKTRKPLVTKTPFLTVSTCGYLQHLHNLGFRTFRGLIDERYDRYHRLEDRICAMVDVLEHIIGNGAEQFYHASKDILDHNFARLCEISGGWLYECEQAMWSMLERSTINTDSR
jgi:hypothetical protein